MTPNLRKFRVVVVAALLAATPGSVFGTEFGAELSLASVYTNNLTLAPDDLARSQWVNAVIPRVYLTHSGPRFDADLDYQLQALLYAGNSELNEAFSQLWATGLIDLYRDELTFRGFARATQVNIDPEGRLSGNNVNVTGNRSDAFGWELGPRWQRNLFGSSDIDAFYYVGRIDYADDNIQGSDSQIGRVTLGSTDGSARRASYRLLYRYRNFDYDNTDSVEFQTAQVELGFFATPFFQLVGIFGSESNLAQNDGKLDEPYWEAGFRSWFGTNQVEAFAGKRFYGPTYRAEWRRTSNVSEFRLSYLETQQTDEGQALDDLNEDIENGLNPAQDTSLTADSTIVRPGSGNRSLNRRFRADYRWSRNLSSLLVYGFYLDQEQIASLALTPEDALSKNESTGVGVDYSWDFGAMTTASVRSSFVNRQFDVQQPDGGRANDLFQIDFVIDYRIGVFTEINAGVGYRNQNGDSVDYNELHAAVRFRRDFWGRR